MKLGRFLIIFISLVSFTSFYADSYLVDNVYIYKYVININDIKDGVIITSEDMKGKIFNKAVCDKDYSCEKWNVNDPRYEYNAEKKSDKIILKGKLNGKNIKQEYKVDDSPWFQYLEVQTAVLVKQGLKKANFYIINPDDAKLYKINFVYESDEEISYKGTNTKALKYKLTASGVPEFMYCVYQYYDMATGDFIKQFYKEDSGYQEMMKK